MRYLVAFVFVFCTFCSSAFCVNYTLTTAVSGQGTVVSSPSGINCPSSCSASFASGTVITLTATPSSNFVFSQWQGGCTNSAGCSITISGNALVLASFEQINPQGPETWEDNNKLLCGLAKKCPPSSPGSFLVAPQYELNLATQTWVTGPPNVTGCTSATFHLPYWTVGTPVAGTAYNSSSCSADHTGLQAAYCDVEACRTGAGGNIGLIIDRPTSLFTSGNSIATIVIPQSSSTQATAPIIVRSVDWANLPDGQVPCDHGINDNVATLFPSQTIRISNPDCTGQNMYFTLGPTCIPASGVCAITNTGTIAGWTTISVNTTTLAAISTTGSNVLVGLFHGYVSPTLGGIGVSCITIDTGANQECVTPVAGPNQTGLYATFKKTHASGVCVVYNTTGCSGTVVSGTGAFVLANGTVQNTSNYNDVQYMSTTETSNTTGGSAIQFCNPTGSTTPPACKGTTIGPNMWEFEDEEIRIKTGVEDTAFIVGMLPSGSETATTQYASDIHFRHDWIHADWLALATGVTDASAGLNWWCFHCSFGDSKVSGIIHSGTETHSITAQGGIMKYYNSVLEGASSGLFSGGFGASNPPSISGYVPYCDIQAEKLLFTYNFSWLGQSPIAGNSHWSGSTVRKNSLENKEGCRIIYDGLIIENVDNSGAQNGNLFLASPYNASSGGGGVNYENAYNNVVLENSILRNGCDAIVLERSDDSNGGVGNAVQDVSFLNLLIYSVSTKNPGCSTADANSISFDGAGETFQGIPTCNGISCTFVANCSADQAGCPGQVSGFTITNTGSGCVAGSITFTGGTQYSGGQPPIATYTCAGGALSSIVLTTTANNIKAGSYYTVAPTISTFSNGCTGCAATVNLVTSPIQPPQGWQILDINAGDPAAVICPDNSSFNSVPTTSYSGNFVWPSGVTTLVSTGSGPWLGSYGASNPAGLTVTYPSSVSGTDNLNYCTILNMSGSPQNIYINHVTLVDDSTWSITSSNTHNNTGPNHQIFANFQNSILLGGGLFNNDRGVGTPTAIFNYDTTTFTLSGIVWPGQIAANYTSYGANPAFPVASPTQLFPVTSYCTGSTTTAYTGPATGCVGFVGAMSTSSMPLTFSDYHSLIVRPDSSFYAGSTYGASDGTSMGANITTIDATLGQNCYTSCNTSTGPFPDNLALQSAHSSAIF